VLPSTLRRQVEALEETLSFTRSRGGAPADAARVLQLADAIRRRRRLRMSYRTFAGDESERELSPYGLVVHRGRWYVSAYDHLRDDFRTFRLDRMWRTTLADEAARPAPEDFDAVDHVTRSLASVPWGWEVEVLLGLPIDEAARRIPATLAEVVEDRDGTVLRMHADSLEWMATVLAGLGCDFTIRRPDELRESVRLLGERLVAQA
jgi:predicted DNA-binding transcriptional regulator YafY